MIDRGGLIVHERVLDRSLWSHIRFCRHTAWHGMAGIESLVLPSEGIPREQTGPLIRRLAEWH